MLTVLIQPSLINTRQIMQLIYSDILVTGRLVSWASGPLYSDVDILTLVVRIAQIYLFPVAVKLSVICSLFDLEIPSTSTLCQDASPHIFNPV